MNTRNEEMEINWTEEVKKIGEQAEKRSEYLKGSWEELEARQAERDRKAREAWEAMSPEERARAEARMKEDRMW